MCRLAALNPDAEPEGSRAVLLSVLRSLCRNPLILSVTAGLVWNLCAMAATGASGSSLPWFLEDFTGLLGLTFTPLVLFLAGSWSVGSFAAMGTPTVAATAGMFVLVKAFALPLLIRALSSVLRSGATDVNFGFEYGLLPAATSVVVVAKQYAVDGDGLKMYAGAVLLGKFASFVLLFIYVGVTTIPPQLLQEQVLPTYSIIMTIASTIGASWLFCCSTILPCMRTQPNSVLVGLAGWQLGFAITFIVSSIDTVRHQHVVGQQLEYSKRWDDVLFAVTSFFRWGIDGCAS